MSVEVVTFGCRLNAVDSAAMARAAAGSGPLAIVNTCAVTAEAVRQGRQAVRRLHRAEPGRRLLVTGCAATIDPAAFAAMPGVDAVVPNALKTDPAVWGGTAHEGPAIARENLTRATLAVQTGCDHRCTFCIIPQGRGAARSVPLAAVCNAAVRLADQGFREIVLTGVDLTSYGADRPDSGDTLGRLVRALLRAAPDLPRLRLSSIDCIEADDDLIDALANEPRLAPHLHLSLQSGDDLVLKRMRRRHLRAQAVDFCRELRTARPDIRFDADLIAGFPTETEAAFERTLALVTDCGLAHVHVFPYSPRPGTPAARMPAVPAPTVRERAERLRARASIALAAHLDRHVGRTGRILMERGGVGRLPDFSRVRVPDLPAGTLADIRIAGRDGSTLVGHTLPAAEPMP